MDWKEIVAECKPIKGRSMRLLEILTNPPNKKHYSDELGPMVGYTGNHPDRAIRLLCEHLGKAGYPVVGDKEGVWFTTDPGEVMDYVDRRTEEADAAHATTMERLAAQRATAYLMRLGVAGQLKMF